jgi:hypothetical protein
MLLNPAFSVNHIGCFDQIFLLDKGYGCKSKYILDRTIDWIIWVVEYN